MYAIVEIAGQQFKVTKDQKLYVHRLNEERGANVEFTQVLLVDADGKIKVGAPVVEGAKVEMQADGEVTNPTANFITGNAEETYEYTIKGEFVANGFEQNTLRHEKIYHYCIYRNTFYFCQWNY